MRTAMMVMVMGVVVVAAVYTMFAYLTNLQNTPPSIEQERKGRAQYLIDTRLPSFNWDWIFDWDWQSKDSGSY